MPNSVVKNIDISICINTEIYEMIPILLSAVSMDYVHKMVPVSCGDVRVHMVTSAHALPILEMLAFGARRKLKMKLG